MEIDVTRLVQGHSELTVSRPDIWLHALEIATRFTGYLYLPKLERPDGTVSACGSRGGLHRDGLPPRHAPQKTELEILDEELEEVTSDIEEHERDIKYYEDGLDATKASLKKSIKRRDDLLRQKEKLQSAPVVYVPEGAVDWLLHEVGHFVAASPAERLKPDYGIGLEEYGHAADREWQAWAFQQMVLEPFGHARLLTPHEYRGGVGYSRSRIPDSAFRRIENQMRALNAEVGLFRDAAQRWVEWGHRQPVKPWEGRQ